MNDTPPPATHPISWMTAFKVYTEPACLRLFGLGIAAGLPLLLVLGTLSLRLREAGIDLATIGYMTWAGLMYGFKWVWSPLVDHLRIPWFTHRLGQRRSWLLCSQCIVIIGLIGMGMSHPQHQLFQLGLLTLLTAWGSATQDIALDAFRIESASVQQQAALSACYQTGYRLAMIWAGAGTLWLAALAEKNNAFAHFFSSIFSNAWPAAQAVLSDTQNANLYHQQAWQSAYFVMACTMLIGVITVLLSPEPQRAMHEDSHEMEPQQGHGMHKGARLKFALGSVVKWLERTVLNPFTDFLQRYRGQAVLILLLIATYRISDIVMGVMANPFYHDMGYSKEEIALVSKIFGVVMTLCGAFLGGVLSMRLGVMRTLLLGAVLSATSNVLFAWLSINTHDILKLSVVVSADNLCSGIASAAFIAYLSSLTNVRYSATQYALFSSMMVLLPKWLAGFSGDFVQAQGYTTFFIGTALLGVPVLALIAWAQRSVAHASDLTRNAPSPEPEPQPTASKSQSHCQD